MPGNFSRGYLTLGIGSGSSQPETDHVWQFHTARLRLPLLCTTSCVGMDDLTYSNDAQVDQEEMDDLKLLLADAGQVISVLPNCPER